MSRFLLPSIVFIFVLCMIVLVIWRENAGLKIKFSGNVLNRKLDGYVLKHSVEGSDFKSDYHETHEYLEVLEHNFVLKLKKNESNLCQIGVNIHNYVPIILRCSEVAARKKIALQHVSEVSNDRLLSERKKFTNWENTVTTGSIY